MAKINWGITSGFVGKLGNVVGFNWKGQNIQRAHNVNGSKSRTKDQSLQRAKFALITHAGSDLYEAVYEGYHYAARTRRTTQNGLFVKDNMMNVIGDDAEQLVLDYEHLQLSSGKLLGVDFGEATLAGNVLSVSIVGANLDDRRVAPNDRVYLCAYCPDCQNAKCKAVGVRGDEEAISLTLPAKWASKRIYAYGFVIGAASYNDALASKTEYLGYFDAEGAAQGGNPSTPSNSGQSGTGSNTGTQTGGNSGGNTGGNSGAQNGGNNGGNASGDTTEAETLAAPVISGASPFAESTQVTITGPDGAEIHYTTDGSTPTAESTLYSEALTITETTTVKAVAIKDGDSSTVSSRQFTKGAETSGEN